MSFFERRRLWFVVLLLLVCLPAARASIVISGTRVIYDAGSHDASIRISNNGTEPSLVQVWTDEGDARVTPDETKAPFLVMPPLFRLNPGRAQMLRISFTGDPLPEDRESLFWLNVLDLPPLPKKSADGERVNVMQVAIRSRIKLFFRPRGLPGSSREAIRGLRWEVIAAAPADKAAPDRSAAVRVINDSAFHVSLGKVAVFRGEAALRVEGVTIPPRGEQELSVPVSKGEPNGRVVVEYETIADTGVISPNRIELP